MKHWALTTIITLHFFVTVQGANKLLNEACTSGDTCVDISGKNLNLLCDVLVKRCLIKAGQSCEDTEDLCINGAFCKNDGQSGLKCTCGTGYTNDDCEAASQKPGASCTSGSGACITAADCTDGRCACNVGHALVEAGTCAAVGANTIGATCTTSTPNTKGDCKDENAVCPAASGGRCVCKDGYVGVTDGGCNIMPNKIGGRCKTDTADTRGTCGDQAVCSATTNGVCQCPEGYEGKNGDNGCYASVGTACNENVVCVASSACDKVFGKCLIIHGASCSGQEDKCVSHATCSSATCACSSGYDPDEAGLCILQNSGRAPGISVFSLVYMLVAGLCLTIFMV